MIFNQCWKTGWKLQGGGVETDLGKYVRPVRLEAPVIPQCPMWFFYAVIKYALEKLWIGI